MKARALLLVTAGILGVAAIACSGAGSSTQDQNQTSKKKGSSGDDGSYDPGSDGPSTDPTTPSSTTPAQDGGASDSGAKDGGGGGGPPKLVCAAIPTCTNVTKLTSISADGTESTSTSGAGSQWLSIHMREDAIADKALTALFDLTPPAGAGYEVHVYDTDCSTELATSTTYDDGLSEAYVTWDDRSFLDDAKDILIEVRYLGGACTAADRWTLDIYGGI